MLFKLPCQELSFITFYVTLTTSVASSLNKYIQYGVKNLGLSLKLGLFVELNWYTFLGVNYT